MNARELSRSTGAVLREVGLEGRSFAVQHCGRVIGFLVPVGGRVPVRRGRHIVYEVPEPEPLLELDDVEASIVGTLYRQGESVPDRLIGEGGTGPLFIALARLEVTKPPLVLKTWGGYKLTAAGERHAEELGL